MAEEQWLLAKYDFRSKQQYIYRTNAIREIAGASALMTAAYDTFLNALAKLDDPVKVKKNYRFEQNKYMNDDVAFAPDLTRFAGEVLYVGGGNLYILWRDRETAERATRVLCQLLRETTYSLSPVCGMTAYTGNYAEDISRLSIDFNRCKSLVPPFMPAAVLPFTEMDRKTSLPIAYKDGKTRESLSLESWLKRRKSSELQTGETQLDRLVTDKGDESLLAVLYADGNGMGARVRETMCPQGKPITDYREAVRLIRQFSNHIQEGFVTKPVEQMTQNLNGYRLVVAGGDEITLICNARAALQAVKTYFKAVADSGSENTACAGICVFHSHFPFSTAYQIAEECCENAKRVNRRCCGERQMLVDFQFCGGVGGDLESMRSGSEQYLARPYAWFDAVGGELPHRLSGFEAAVERLQPVGRSNIKQLAAMRVQDIASYEMEKRRLKARLASEGVQCDFTDCDDYIYDISQFYDIWFGKR